MTQHFWNNEWVLRAGRSIGLGTVAGMALLALIAATYPEDTAGLSKPEYVSWWFGSAVAVLVFCYPLPLRWPLPFVAVRAVAWVLVFAVFFDWAQVTSTSLHWGPWWFNGLVFAAMALAALPLAWPKPSE